MNVPDIKTESLTPLHWAAIVLAFISGVVHFVLGVKPPFNGGLSIAFILAGLGFFGAIILVLIDYRRRLLYPVGVLFVALQIVLYLLINYRSAPAISPTEGIDKAAQILLIIALVVLYRRES